MELVYILKNNSLNDGLFFLNGKYHTLKAGTVLETKTKPASMTTNISLSYYRKDYEITPLPKKKGIKEGEN